MLGPRQKMFMGLGIGGWAVILSSRFVRRMTVYSIIVFLGLSFISWTGGRVSGQVIVFGDDIEYPPFTFLDEHGEPAGFSIELAQAIGQVMGWDVEFQLRPWAEIKENLTRGEIQVIAGMF